VLQENCPDSLEAAIQGLLEFYTQSDGIPVLRINSIWATSLALKAIQTRRGGCADDLLPPVAPQMLSDAWQLLPNCPNYALATHCQDAIHALIGLLGTNLPQDLREKMFPLVFELATKELTVQALTKFDVSLGSKGMYEKVPSGTPGISQYVLKSDISDVAFGLNLLTSLTTALRAEFLEVAERAIPIVSQLLTSHLRVKDIVMPVMNFLLSFLAQVNHEDPNIFDLIWDTSATLLDSVQQDFEASLLWRLPDFVRSAAASP
jgi:hypothetical protein